MERFLTGGIGFAASEIVQQSNVNELAGAITQLLIAIVTIFGLLTKKNDKK